MLEALLLAAAQATAPPPAEPVKPTPVASRPLPPAASKPAPPPSAELLEFLAEWGGEEAGLIDEISMPGAVARPPRKESAP